MLPLQPLQSGRRPRLAVPNEYPPRGNADNDFDSVIASDGAMVVGRTLSSCAHDCTVRGLVLPRDSLVLARGLPQEGSQSGKSPRLAVPK